MKRLIVGGGNGLMTTLKAIGDSEENTIVFTVVDSGRDTGKIRKKYPEIIPIGDVKKHIWALRPETEYNFITTHGHKFWNELVFELVHNFGPNEGLDHLRKIVGIKSKIYPISTKPSNLYAQLKDKIVIGEYVIENITERIYKVWLEPKVSLNPKLKEIEFDVVILGPGSMYGSLISNLLVDEFTDLIKDKKKVLILNGTNRFGYTMEDYVKEFEKYGYNPDIIIAPKGIEGNADYFVKTMDGKYDISELRKALEEVI